MIFIIQLATVQGRLHPNFYWETQPPHLSDLTTFYFVFAIVGVSSWLFNRQTDRSLHRALRAESALQREKATLETKVIARTQELEKAQAEKIRQLHRFAELGQFSTSLLHDLSNHITTLSVDIEGMGEQNKNYHSQLQLRIQRRIAYIDAMVQWAHDHINGKVQTRLFDATHEVQAVVKLLQYNARNAHVQLHGMPKDTPKLMLHGDPNRFQQLITNLISNAIDAYHDAPSTKHDVFITGAQNDDDSITITVHDTGAGIPEDIQKHIFDAFYTTKQNGMGIGLFIVKQIVEEYFDGTIELSSQKGETIFTVRLRKMHENTSSPDGN
jgi:signal transduction histidine kinase